MGVFLNRAYINKAPFPPKCLHWLFYTVYEDKESLHDVIEWKARTIVVKNSTAPESESPIDHI